MLAVTDQKWNSSESSIPPRDEKDFHGFCGMHIAARIAPGFSGVFPQSAAVRRSSWQTIVDDKEANNVNNE